LKHPCIIRLLGGRLVAPCAGAWIETISGSRMSHDQACRPLRGGVD